MDKIQQHIKEVKEDTEKLEVVAEKLAIVKEEIFDMKVDILSSAFAMLMTKFNESIDDWLKIISEKGEKDKGIGVMLKQEISKLVTVIAEQKTPNIEFKPQVKVDMQPIAAEIAKGHNIIIPLLDKIVKGDGGKSDELHRYVIALIKQQSVFMEKSFQQFDYTKQLTEISTGVNKKQDGYLGKITARENINGTFVIKEFEINPKEAAKTK